MDPYSVIAQLDGREEVAVACKRGDLPEQYVWLARLYGYKYSHLYQGGGKSNPYIVYCVRDESEQAGRIASWMRFPTFVPGAPAPVAWSYGQAGWASWAPPGWPPGYTAQGATQEQLRLIRAELGADVLGTEKALAAGSFVVALTVFFLCGAVVRVGNPSSMVGWLVAFAVLGGLLGVTVPLLRRRRQQDEALLTQAGLNFDAGRFERQFNGGPQVVVDLFRYDMDNMRALAGLARSRGYGLSGVQVVEGRTARMEWQYLMQAAPIPVSRNSQAQEDAWITATGFSHQRVRSVVLTFLIMAVISMGNGIFAHSSAFRLHTITAGVVLTAIAIGYALLHERNYLSAARLLKGIGFQRVVDASGQPRFLPPGSVVDGEQNSAPGRLGGDWRNSQ
ncbi:MULTISPECIES: hypothetical protein [unclassified Streptomyces]|uniref:hypothetical protein n=1 Tax=unclassified Streptomyces TaxID=2593676 RepID=UPI0022511E35|nr:MULTISPECIES: hypothetical protein [unclassified Streptomyces]MCX4550289.1 hypothetical protein [Streptomyces sp. NBC_01500]WSC21785.1 hypothetical protein OIE60_20015 [Streptomyces sp. NBC_01766]